MLITHVLFAQSEFKLDKRGLNKVPFTNKGFINNPDNFQFAIVADRTGGHRLGVFSEGIKKINSLQPEFVLSVGDLIEGYTENKDVINNQWDSFMESLKPLDMNFFFVAGNHDYINKTMGDIWKERFGADYYHFIYKNTLFLCLNSEDNYGGAGKPFIGEEQFNYFKKALAENKDVRWTFVIMHQPMWAAKNKSSVGKWFELQNLLTERKHTTFAGHVHQYTHYEVNESDYITLATTGGISSMRGKAFGEFDHVLWVTMKDEGPVMANLMLDGIQGIKVSTEESVDLFNQISKKPLVGIAPAFINANNNYAIDSITIQAHNYLSDYAVEMSLHQSAGSNYMLESEGIDLYLEPNEKKEIKLPVAVINSDKTGILEMSKIGKLIPKKEFKSVTYYDKPYLSWNSKMSFSPQEKYKLKTQNKQIVIDGKINDWKELPYKVQNKSDSNSFQFNIVEQGDYIYVGLSVEDDTLLMLGNDSSGTDFEGAFVSFDTRTINQSAYNDGNIENLIRGDWFGFAVNPTKDSGTISHREMWPKIIDGYYVVNEKGYTAEFQFPKALIIKNQGPDWNYFRFNIGVNDKSRDANKDIRLERNYWKPMWNTLSTSTGFFFKDF